MKPEVRKLLFDALQACRRIAEFTVDKSFDDYDANALLSSAVERQFEIVGEALNQVMLLDDTIEERVEHVRQIIGLRNRIIHGYATVSNLIVWRIVQDELPELAKQLEHALDEG